MKIFSFYYRIINHTESQKRINKIIKKEYSFNLSHVLSCPIHSSSKIVQAFQFIIVRRFLSWFKIAEQVIHY